MGWLSDRAAVFGAVLDRKWVKVALGLWSVVASYDLLISQFLPARWAEKAPKVRDLIAETSGWLPFWAWLLILAAILVIAMLEYSVRKTPRDRLADGVWHSAASAVEAFCDSELIANRNKWKETFDAAALRGHVSEDRISALRKMNGGVLGIADTQELKINERKLQAAAMQWDIAKDELGRAWEDLRADIESKLTKGGLVAKGFRAPHTGGTAEIEISSAEWRILSLNNVTSEVLKKGMADVLYSGVVIRRTT